MKAAHRQKNHAKAELIVPQWAHHDLLTELPNRRRFTEHLHQAVAKGQRMPFGLIVLGLDRFRDINHILGPKSGDLLLNQVARRFDQAIDNATTKARIGGDEFAAILGTAGESEIDAICNAILRALDAPFVIEQLPIDLSASIGVALCPKHGADADLLFQHANIALEYTKQFGRGYSVYNEANDPYTQLKRAYVGGLRNAIEQNQITLYYQPKVDLRTGGTRGVEALVHWNHPVHGTVLAQQFVPVAERTGLIHSLSRWVLRSAIEQCDVWRRLGREMPVAVNLSPRNFHDDQLPDYIDGLLERHRLPAKLLEIEITESVILTDGRHISKALYDLSRKGVRIFIDDFGTGYSSLGHLKRLPVTGVKIDRIFISQLTSHAPDAAIVRSIIDLGHRLGLEVIAEGVETRGIWQKLASLNCDAAQGYLMCPPRPAADLDDWLVHAPWKIGNVSRKKKRATPRLGRARTTVK